MVERINGHIDALTTGSPQDNSTLSQYAEWKEKAYSFSLKQSQ
jgi:hypothetical protein